MITSSPIAGVDGVRESEQRGQELLGLSGVDYRPEAPWCTFLTSGLCDQACCLQLVHDAADHAGELVRLWTRLGGDVRPPPPSESAELARLARSQAALESRAGQFAIEARAARSEYERLLKRLDGVGHELGVLKATRRYRIAAAMASPLDAARRLRASFNGRNGPESHD